MSILVLCEDAPDYAEFLEPATDTVFARNLQHANTEKHSFEILLAQPDLAVQYLRTGRTPHWIQSTWAGIEPLAQEALAKRVLITGIKGIFGPLIAEYVFAYLLDDVRDLNRTWQAQSTKQWQPYLPGTLQNRHLVIVGTGSIGQHVAAVARSFRMRVTGVSRSGATSSGFDATVSVSQLPDVLHDADYCLVALPGTAETTGLIDADVLAALPREAMLLNIGRGVTVDEDALIAAMKSQRLRKAVLDVFQTEPLPSENPLWDSPATYITPHLSAVSRPQDIATIFLRNLGRYRSGTTLEYVVDLQRGY